MTFPPGTLVAGRFSVRRMVGRGGMGLVYEAHDSESGHTVALKVMQPLADSEAARRFVREAQVLSRLSHPGIVAYVAHGLTDDGQPFLAMEWLEGEDLARRLARQPLAFSEVLGLLRRAAEILAVAHAQGIIHRDIKPSNLFLCGGKVEQLKLLDFGLARVQSASQSLTHSRALLGTPGYMAPEQASNQTDITPSADIFSLGCVLYECLTGQAPFRAPHWAAILAKILYTEPLQLQVLRPELPVALQGLMDRMLAKDPVRRLSDGQQLLQVLPGLGASHDPLSPALMASSAPELMEAAETEHQLVSVLLAAREPPSKEELTQTVGAEDAKGIRTRLESLLQELRARGAKASLLANDSLLATFLLERGTATDQAALAGHCALFVQERWPDSLVVLTTGLSLRGRPLPVGEVLDRAGELLRQQVSPRSPPLSHVIVDQTTAGLLEHQFELDKKASGASLLLSERLDMDKSRPLLGRPTPCVGREQELAMLELALSSSMEDSAARALLVTAPAGTGKSRLRHEFLRRLDRRDQPPLVLLGRGDPMIAGSAYGLLGHAVRRLCGVIDGELLETRREKLANRVSRHLLPDQLKDTVEFLGELCGVPSDDSPKLRAAREDPRLMSLQVMRAMVSFLRAELAQGPVLLVLEDLHWSDAPTVRLVDEVLSALAECPLVVLALARPEVKELFPRLWPRWLQEMPLRGLSQKASARLAQEVLGSQISAPEMARLVEQAAGNALFLEELIRSIAEGRGEETPGTVLAMLQSRLQRLEIRLRRVLMAGAIFGRTFWTGGIKGLVDEGMPAADLEQCLRQLTDLEVVEHQDGSRFPAQTEYRFRHALVRDAAYSMVPERLKPMSHRHAGAWLEQAGEQDPMVLAEHYQLGQDKQKAAGFFTRAAERFVELDRQELQGAQRCLAAALACEPAGEILVRLRAVEMMTSFWAEGFEHAYAIGSRVLPELQPGSTAWGRVMGVLMLMAAQSGRYEELMSLRERFLTTAPAPEAMPAYTQAACFLNSMHTWGGQRAEAARVLERMDQMCTAMAERDEITRGWLYCARGFFEHFFHARPWRSRTWAEQGTQAFLEVNSDSNVTATQTLWGLTLAALGDVPHAVKVMREGLASAHRAGMVYPINYTQMHLILVLICSNDPAHHEEARQLALHTLETEKTNVMRLGIAHLALARVAGLQRRLLEAEAQARKACEVLGMFVPYRLMAHITLSSVLLAQQRVTEARAEAERGVRSLEQMGGAGALSVGTWLALAEACFAQHEQESGERALREALKCVSLRAEDIPDAAVREGFLTQVPENARVRELARQHWGAGWDSKPAGQS